MTIQISEDFKTATIDAETHKRLTTGTTFQRSMNCIAMIDEIMDEIDNDFIQHAGLTGKAKKAFLKDSRNKRADSLKKLMPISENFDRSALDFFYD